MQRILNAIDSPLPALPEAQLSEYRTATILHRFQVILTEINQFFDQQHSTRIPELTPLRVTQLRAQQLLSKVKKRYLNLGRG
jgi:hypothetical protein